MKKNDTGYIYVAELLDNHIKIGITTNPDRRLRTLETSTGFQIKRSYVSRCITHLSHTEYLIFKCLHQYRKLGEFFDIDYTEAVSVVGLFVDDRRKAVKQLLKRL